MLRGQAVVDRDDGTTSRIRKPSADGVDGVERSQHPSAAVEVDERGKRLGSVREIEACSDLAGRPGQCAIEDFGNGLGHCRSKLQALRLARLFNGELVQGPD